MAPAQTPAPAAPRLAPPRLLSRRSSTPACSSKAPEERRSAGAEPESATAARPRPTLTKGANANLGYMYVTDQKAYSAQSGQYDNSTQLPSYWKHEVSALDQSCPGSSCVWSGHHVRVIHKRKFHGRFTCQHYRGTCHCRCERPMGAEAKYESTGAAPTNAQLDAAHLGHAGAALQQKF